MGILKRIPINVIMITGPTVHETATSVDHIKRFVARRLTSDGMFDMKKLEVNCLHMIPIDSFHEAFDVSIDEKGDVEINRENLTDLCQGHNAYFVFDGCEPPELFNEAMRSDDRKITDPTVSKLTIYRNEKGEIYRSSFYTF